MSGPKVVRIVTREEILAICHGQLARLDALDAEWTRRCDRSDCLDQQVAEANRQRRDELAAMLAADDLTAFQKQVTEEMAFLSADLDKRLAAAAASKAAAASRVRRQAEAAQALIKALSERDQNADRDLIERLAAVAKGAEDAQAIAQGFAALASDEGDPGAEKRKELAAQYRADLGDPSLSSWLESQERSPDERRLAAVERQLADLQLTDEETARLFAQRFADMLKQDERRRSLLLDSLELDLSKIAAAARARTRLAREVELTLAELQDLSPEIVGTYSTANLGYGELEKLLEDVTAKLQSARNAAGLASRRKAILQSLAALGYETNEEMETAWATHGRVVLRNSTKPDYGVEIAGNATEGRVQMRTVAIGVAGATPDVRRDVEAETSWCGEVAELTSRIAKAGGRFSIEKAYPVGAVPIKRVAGSEASERRRAREGPAPKTRTLS